MFCKLCDQTAVWGSCTRPKEADDIAMLYTCKHASLQAVNVRYSIASIEPLFRSRRFSWQQLQTLARLPYIHLEILCKLWSLSSKSKLTAKATATDKFQKLCMRCQLVKMTNSRNITDIMQRDFNVLRSFDGQRMVAQ